MQQVEVAVERVAANQSEWFEQEPRPVPMAVDQRGVSVVADACRVAPENRNADQMHLASDEGAGGRKFLESSWYTFEKKGTKEQRRQKHEEQVRAAQEAKAEKAKAKAAAHNERQSRAGVALKENTRLMSEGGSSSRANSRRGRRGRPGRAHLGAGVVP